MKDFALIGSDPYFAEVGEGNLEWEAILEAARRAGVRWYIVEQDQPFPGRDIFDSLALSFENMREMGLS
jgi:sugar phosphate isomerase/epimerase